ncbi:ADP-ribose pyrophosphatase [Carbonactinospora thermoautotrophica]|uniref:ADP-ribose pyrophosphatase n=1 Tax=Carbonactinospora thermoautotrophica TaxID=1469144 RepID=A0A132MSK5_9ACTN|nr:ADP-ribose pyrophosphatase [Carbonactinospora thermoautotrophica]
MNKRCEERVSGLANTEKQRDDQARVRDQEERWPVEASASIYKGRVIGLRADTLRMPDGQTAVREVVEHPGAVSVIALDEEDRVLVVRQYRHPVGHRLWEPPAGLLDVPGENPLHAAQRELYEEGHHRASDWRVLVDLFTSPGTTEEAIRIYLARGLTEVPDGERYVGQHEEADMTIAWVPFEELVRLILAGELHNPTLVAGVLALAAARAGDGVEALRPADAPWPQRPF